MLERLDAYKTYQSDNIYHAFRYLVENVTIDTPRLSQELATFPGGRENTYRLLLGVLLADGNVAWSPDAPSHPAILQAEGKGRGDTLAYFQIGYPVCPGPSKIIITGLDEVGTKALTEYIVAARPDPRSSLFVQQVDNLPDVGQIRKIFQGTVRRYEFLENLRRGAPILAARIYHFMPI